MRMYRHSFAATLALVVSTVLGLAGPAAAGELVPLRARLAGSFTVTPVSPFIRDILLTATGNATHLGRFTMVSPHRVDASTVPSTVTGSFTLKAANGDTVYGTFSGNGTPTSTPGVISV